MNKIYQIFEKIGLPTIAIGLGTLVYLFFISSNYLHYGAEGIFINGLVRLLGGHSYISGFETTPLVLSTYFPTAYLFYYPFGKLLGLDTPQSVGYLVRILSPIYYIGYFYILKTLIPRCSKEKWSSNFVMLGLLFFLLKEFTLFFSFKPDSHAMLLEILGFVLALIFYRENKNKLIVASAILFAFAAIVKLNMVGLGLGVGLSLLFNKRFHSFVIFAVTGLLTLSLGLVSIYYWLGADLFSALLETTGSDVVPLNRLPGILNRVFFEVLIPYIIIFYLAYSSLLKKALWSGQQKALLYSAGTISLALAIAGQFKRGAAVNYFYEFILFGIILSGFAFANLERKELQVTFRKILGCLIVFMMIHLSLLPLQIATNDLNNYDFVGMNDYLDKNFDNPRVYTENNNAAVHLSHRALLGVSFFVFLNATKSIGQKKSQFLELLNREGRVDAIAVSSSGCQNFKPDKRFQAALIHLDKLVYQKGKICIFAR